MYEALYNFCILQFDLNIIPAKLETLNLHKNYIANLTPNDEEKALKYLDLSGNNINFLPANVFSKLEHLEYLRLSNNMLKSLDFYKQLPVSLKKLDLRTNLMETLTEEDDKMMVNFGHLKLLEELFISQNLWICSCNFKVLLKFVEFENSALSPFSKFASFQVPWETH